MDFTQTPLKGSYLINLNYKTDERGFFSRVFCENEFKEMGLNTRWVQINNSLSVTSGTLRGLHFQYPPHSEVKLIRCVRGAIWDVIVDIRKNSLTYGQWFAYELNEENRTMMYVPEGFAHGFISLVDNTEIFYLVSSPYSPQAEGTLRWNDSFHGINWPMIPVLVSVKDQLVENWNVKKAI